MNEWMNVSVHSWVKKTESLVLYNQRATGARYLSYNERATHSTGGNYSCDARCARAEQMWVFAKSSGVVIGDPFLLVTSSLTRALSSPPPPTTATPVRHSIASHTLERTLRQGTTRTASRKVRNIFDISGLPFGYSTRCICDAILELTHHVLDLYLSVRKLPIRPLIWRCLFEFVIQSTWLVYIIYIRMAIIIIIPKFLNFRTKVSTQNTHNLQQRWFCQSLCCALPAELCRTVSV